MTRIVKQARRKLLHWSLLEALSLLVGGVSAAGLLAALLSRLDATGAWGRGLFLLWLALVLSLVLWRLAAVFLAFASPRAFVRRIESLHPEYRNEISTVEYLTSRSEETRSLGFSPDLVRAIVANAENLPEPRWERLGIGFAAKRRALYASGAGILAFALLSLSMPGAVLSTLRDWALGEELTGESSRTTIVLPDLLEIPIGRKVSIGPASTGAEIAFDWGRLEEGTRVEFLAKNSGASWRLIGSLHKSADPIADSTLSLKVEGPIELFTSIGGIHGARCRIEAVYPPAVKSFEAAAHAPEYVGREPKVFHSTKRIEAHEGSRLVLSWTANNDLTSATFELFSATRDLLGRFPITDWIGPRTARTELDLPADGAGRLLLLDRFGQRGVEPEIRFLALPDRPPEAAILSPTRETILPQDLRVAVDCLVADDLALARVDLVYRVDTGLPGAAEKREVLAASATLGASTGGIFKRTLDLTEADLWPGDQVAFWIEATDFRGDKPGRVGRSDTHIVRFPTVEESLDEMASLRSQSTDGLQKLLEEQKEIGRQFKEIRQDLQRNLSNRGDPDKQWENQKRLAETLDRQSDVDRQLSEVADQLEETLKRLSEDSQLTLRTLQKFERVQELMDQVLTDETKRLIREIQDTLKRLQEEELQPDALEETELQLAEFEKQLDRQLELLENLWMEQELEALRDQVQELADRQEELKQSTLALLTEEDRQALVADEKVENSETSLADQLENLESTAERLAEELSQEKSASESKEEPADSTGAEEKDPSEKAQEEKGTKIEESGSQEAEETQGPENSDSTDPTASEMDPAASEPQEGAAPEQKDVLAQRQDQLTQDTKRALDDLKRLAERAKERNHPSSEQMEQMAESSQQESIPSDQQSAERNLRRNQPQRAAQKQSSASKQLAQLSEMLGACCSGSDKNMEESIAKMKEILERAFILSEESETSDLEIARFRPLPEWPNSTKMSGLGQRMGLYRQEASRLSQLFGEVAEGNPFADFEVIRRFDTAARGWKENTRTMEESPPLPVSVRSHQSVAQVNLAIERLLDSISQSQANCQSGSAGMEGYFRGLKQILSEQRRLNQESQQMKDEKEGSQPDSQGEGQEGMSWQEKMQRMADQQRRTRQMLEELDQRYQNLKQRAGNLDGVGEDMQAVEKELEGGRLNDQVVQTQKKIEQRLLDAEKSLHNQGFEKSRRALKSEEDPLAPVVDSPQPSAEELQADLARLLRNDLSDVPPHWRERVRSYYDSLLRTPPQIP